MTTLDLAIDAVSRIWEIDRSAVLNGRETWAVEARFTVCYILSGQGMSLSEIGRQIGRDAGAVKGALRQVKNWISTQDGFRNRNANAVGTFNYLHREATRAKTATDDAPASSANAVRLDYTDERGIRCSFSGDAQAVLEHLQTHLIPDAHV